MRVLEVLQDAVATVRGWGGSYKGNPEALEAVQALVKGRGGAR